MSRTAIPTAPTPADIQDIWSCELRPGPSDLIDSRVPLAARGFLTTVGLPMKPAQGISFTDVPAPAGTHLAVGANLDQDLFGVDPTAGRVDLISHIPGEPVQFVNSSLPLFVFSLGLYLRGVWEFLTPNPTEDPQRRIGAVDRFRSALTARDPAAVAAEGYYSPDMIAGLLRE